MSLYLDYNASAPLDPRVLDAMVEAYKTIPGNPDSRTHTFGTDAREAVETARKQVAELLGIASDEVVFTSGATESNNIALLGLQAWAEKTGKKHIITTAMEHKSVLETAKALAKKGYEVDFVKPDSSGRISADEVCSLVREDTLLVSIMHVNNETGMIQPVQEIGQFLKERGVLFHIDATQSFGKLVEELRNTSYDLLSLSAHKIGGPQGIGALVLRKKRYRRPPVQGITFGGQQENGIRPGTIPTALCVGLGKASQLAAADYKETHKKNASLQEAFIKALNDSGVDFEINGDLRYCMDSTLNIYLPGVSSEALMLMAKSFCSISNGSACTSKSYTPSYVLKAMGCSDDRAGESIRISWGPDTELKAALDAFQKLLQAIRSIYGE